MEISNAHNNPREQALDRGLLIDVTEHARQAGIHVPVALTPLAWAASVDVRQSVDQDARLSDLFAALRLTLAQERRSDTAHFRLKVTGLTRPQDYKCLGLKATQTRTHDGQEAITIMLPDESFRGLLQDPCVPLAQSLLVEMTITLRELAQVARSHDQQSRYVLEQVLGHLVDEHPHGVELISKHNHFALFPSPSIGRHPLPEIAAAPSDQDKREKLLNNVQDIIDALLTLGPRHAETAATLQASVNMLRSPMATLLHLVRDLLVIAAATIHCKTDQTSHPFDTLLAAHSRLSTSFLYEHTTDFPRCELTSIETQSHELLPLVPRVQRERIAHLQRHMAHLASRPAENDPFAELEYPAEQADWKREA